MKTKNHSNLKLLEEKNSFYKKLLFQSPDLIFQFTFTKEGTIFFPFLSKSVITHFDLKSEEKSMTAFDSLKSRIIPEDFKAFIARVYKAKLELKTWEHEFRAKIPSKGIRWFKGVASVEQEDNGDINFYGKITDITIYKEQEKEIKLSEQRYLFALEASSEGIWDYDVRNKTVFYSSQTMKILGYDAIDTVDSIFFWDSKIHSDDKVRYFKDVQDHIDEETPYYENSQRMLTKNGEYKWILSVEKLSKEMKIIYPCE
ncbi:PAS domain-containing protein [Flavobacterium myungsuense]|uniref:PAS domain-containing protein n=1 Tax=Flavobacterium myungsuense TaxID=651823 RepID=UPI0036252629